MSNPLRILSTLNKHLTAPAEITVFGRSSLALGYDHVPTEIQSTHDVDGILPLHWLELADQAGDFWQAIQSTNLELAPEGLYLTHLFREFDVILQPDWVTRRVEISKQFSLLTVFRPATIDLILTKMARADADDLRDIHFMLEREPLSGEQLKLAFARARVPDVPEILELFVRAQPKVLELAGCRS